MFKKYFQIKKSPGFTSVYFVFKYKDFFSNRKIFFKTDNFIPLNPIVLDQTIGSFVFNATEVKKIKVFDFIISLNNKENNMYDVVLPIPKEYIFNSLTSEELKEFNNLKQENSDCLFEIFQAFQKNEIE